MPEFEEIECVDCGCDIPVDSDEKLSLAERTRCDTCRDHYFGLCGSDCPVTPHNPGGTFEETVEIIIPKGMCLNDIRKEYKRIEAIVNASSPFKFRFIGE